MNDDVIPFPRVGGPPRADSTHAAARGGSAAYPADHSAGLVAPPSLQGEPYRVSGEILLALVMALPFCDAVALLERHLSSEVTK